MKNTWIIGIYIVAFIAAIFFTRGFGLFGSGATGATAEVIREIRIPVSEITKNAKFYEYDYGGTKIRFFAVRADDGSVKTAFDACDICYKNKRGYKQEGNYMVCNNCGKKFSINSLGTENKNPGGCWPGYLSSYVNGDNLIIKKSELENGKWRFA